MTPAKVGGYIVLAGMLTAIYGLSLEKEDKSKSQKVELIGIGIGATGGLVWGGGYMFGGGRSCSQANAMYRNLRLDEINDNSMGRGDNIEIEMRQLTEQFNARAGRPAAAD
jgi:hypothetical protein